jgi:hypothetical protein
MSRRTVVWLLTIPLAIVGSQAAHALGYRLGANGDAGHELASSGHGYLAYAPLALAVCAALVALALARDLVEAVGGRHGVARLSGLAFAVLAPAIFVAQEHFERLAHDGAFPATLVLQKTFLLGLALQIPFTLAAYVLARLLLRATRVVARLLATPRVARLRTRSRWGALDVSAPVAETFLRALGARGPPSSLVV